MHDAKRRVAGGDIVDEDTHRAHIVKLAERHVLALHLFPDAEDVLGPAGDFGAQTGIVQCIADACFHVFDETLAIATFFVEQARNAPVSVRMQMTEYEVFEFPLELPDAKPVRQRRVDVSAEVSQRDALGFGQRGRVAHPHELACEQDQDHPQIAYQRQ